MITLSIKDETFAGKVLNEIFLNFRSQSVTVKEIIEQRVMQEVETYNKKLPEYFKGLVEPTEAETTLNGYRMKKKKMIDPEQQVYVALDAFGKNGFFVLIDDIQSDSLDQVVNLNQDTAISFIKLTPLVGG